MRRGRTAACTRPATRRPSRVQSLISYRERAAPGRDLSIAEVNEVRDENCDSIKRNAYAWPVSAWPEGVRPLPTRKRRLPPTVRERQTRERHAPTPYPSRPNRKREPPTP